MSVSTDEKQVPLQEYGCYTCTPVRVSTRRWASASRCYHIIDHVEYDIFFVVVTWLTCRSLAAVTGWRPRTPTPVGDKCNRELRENSAERRAPAAHVRLTSLFYVGRSNSLRGWAATEWSKVESNCKALSFLFIVHLLSINHEWSAWIWTSSARCVLNQSINSISKSVTCPLGHFGFPVRERSRKANFRRRVGQSSRKQLTAAHSRDVVRCSAAIKVTARSFVLT